MLLALYSEFFVLRGGAFFFLDAFGKYSSSSDDSSVRLDSQSEYMEIENRAGCGGISGVVVGKNRDRTYGEGQPPCQTS